MAYWALISLVCLRPIAPKIVELFRPLDKPPLAELPFFVACRRINQAVDFLTCHFCRFRSLLSTHAGPQGDRNPQLDKPADRFGARWIVLRRRRPAIDPREQSGLKTQGDQRAPFRPRRCPRLWV